MTGNETAVRQESSAQEALDDLLAKADKLGTTPGFLPGASPIMRSRQMSEFRPAHWSYSKVKRALDDATEVLNITTAERRTLVLRNPKLGNDWPTSRTMVSAYQMILPGEVVGSHRHAAHALRLLIDCKGAYSIVDGVKMPMESGDVVLTPGGHWHAHGHEGDEPAYWLDGLDIPLGHLLEPMYMEDYPERVERVTEVATVSPFRFAREDILRGLDEASADPEQAHGPRINLATPDMPTLQVSIERLESGAALRSHRSTANRIFSVMEGRGRSQIGDEAFEWSRGDTFVAPMGYAIRHAASTDSVLFEMSDEALMKFVKIYRKELL